MWKPFYRYKGFWPASRKRSMYVGILLIVLALAVQITLGQFSARQAISASSVRDVFLDNLPVVNLDFVIVLWAIATWVIAWWLLIIEPRRLIFGTKAIALYIMCRAFFITLTHIGAYPTAMSPGPSNIGFGFYSLFTFQGNYFFSGHTAFPFLIALLFGMTGCGDVSSFSSQFFSAQRYFSRMSITRLTYLRRHSSYMECL